MVSFLCLPLSEEERYSRLMIGSFDGLGVVDSGEKNVSLMEIGSRSHG